jgi:hypothetical protein
MGQIDTSIYNRPQADPMQGISNALSIANGIQQNRILGTNANMLSQQYQGQQAVGQAFQGAIRPDGTVDTGAAGTAIANNPNAAYVAPQAFQSAANLAGSNISNTNAGAIGSQSRVSDALGALNSIAAGGGTRQAIMTEALSRLHSGLLAPQDYHSIVDNMPPGDGPAQSYIKTKTAGMIAAPAQAIPATTGINPDLTPKIQTGADQAAAARTPAGIASAPPGAIDVAAADKKAAFEDQIRSSAIMGNVRPLQQALPLISQLSDQNFGPGSAEFAKVKGALTTAGIIDPNTSDLKVRQEANKYLLQYATGAQQAGRSDQGLAAAIGSNPNVDLTQPANLALIKNQIGRDQMDAAMPKLFQLDGKPGQTYSDFKGGYYQKYDPRAFNFHLLSPTEQQKVVSSLGKPGSAAFDKFSHSYDLAKSAGMVQPPAQQQPVQGQ